MRGGAFGAVVWLLTLLGHSAGGGALPDLTGLSVAMVLALALGVAVAGRRRGLPALLALLVAGQVLLHLVLSVTAHAHGGSLNLTMLVSHLGAAVLAALVIDRGEDLVARWAAYLAQAIGVVELVPARPTVLPSRAIATSSADRHTVALEHHVVRRGPPTRLATLH